MTLSKECKKIIIIPILHLYSHSKKIKRIVSSCVCIYICFHPPLLPSPPAPHLSVFVPSLCPLHATHLLLPWHHQYLISLLDVSSLNFYLYPVVCVTFICLLLNIVRLDHCKALLLFVVLTLGLATFEEKTCFVSSSIVVLAD
jgi:hypothetical protein